MPTRPRTTREMILRGALDLIREEGHEELTARRLAARLGCSTQPILYQFPTLAALREAAYRLADGQHTEYILSGGSMLEIGMRYIRFAWEEKNLFRFLFQSGHFSGASLEEMIASPEAEPILSAAGQALGADSPEEAAEMLETLFVAVHGYASLMANNAMTYDPVSVENTLTRIAAGLKGKDETV